MRLFYLLTVIVSQQALVTFPTHVAESVPPRRCLSAFRSSTAPMLFSKDTPLQQLHKGSAKTASFVVRVVHPKSAKYDDFSKYDSKPKTGHKFECYLLGEKQTSYCLGYVRGSENM